MIVSPMNKQTNANIRLRDDEGALTADFVNMARDAIASEQYDVIRQFTADLHDSDIADLLENLSASQRSSLIEVIGAELNPQLLVEVDEAVRDELVRQLPDTQLAAAVGELDSDDAVHLLEDLPQHERDRILDLAPHDARFAVARGLKYPEDSAGRLMQQNFVHVPSYWTVGQTIDFLREDSNLPDQFSQIFVTTPSFHLRGTVALDRLLRTPRSAGIMKIVDDELSAIDARLDQEELARQFDRYNLLSAPVVDDHKRLVGVVTADDVVAVIQEEVGEDLLRLGGVVSDESLAGSVANTAYRRFSWLFINLLTAILASMVISLFDATIEQMVALAVLMPIVASMGGNAGTQTMTVTVRALATRELGAANARRIITREVLVGLLNGLLFALLLAIVVAIWFGSGRLAFVIAAAMIINLLVAALSGILVPLALDYKKIDPAIASSVFVTTLTDIVGFFTFLGLASLLLT